MGRRQQVSEEEFRKAYYKCSGIVSEMAIELGVTRMTVYNYCKRYDVEPKNLRPSNHLELYNSYVGHQSIRTLGRRFKMHSLVVRDKLMRAVEEMWSSDNPPDFPKPQRVFDIKIIKALLENQSMPIGKTVPIASLGKTLSIHQRYVDEYIARIHEKTQRAPSSDEGLRSKSRKSRRAVHEDGDG